ncbi:cytochrome b [Halomonas sp. MA07-2]|uniref:cytochrome b n=1 Tax=unclassified Halomonas TaxID=2609666 RepID=UPI003EF03C56
MNWLDSEQRYGVVSRLVHWAMVPLLLLMLVSDWWMDALSKSSAMGLHKSIGLLLLGLLAFRLVWRWINRGRLAPPAHWQWAALLGHLALYGLLGLILVSGLLAAVGSGHGVAFFGLPLVPAGAEIEWLEEAFEEVHEVAANLLWLVIGGHVVAVLGHQWLFADRTLQRMT